MWASFLPCEGSWNKLLAKLGKEALDDEPLPLAEIHRLSGLDDALWAARTQEEATIMELILRYDEEQWNRRDAAKLLEAVKTVREYLAGGGSWHEVVKFSTFSWAAYAVYREGVSEAYLSWIASRAASMAKPELRDSVFLTWAGE